MPALERLLCTIVLPTLLPLNIKPQYLELLIAVLATEDLLLRLSLEPEQPHIKLQRLLQQQRQSLLPNRMRLNRVLLLLHQEVLLLSKLPVLH